MPSYLRVMDFQNLDVRRFTSGDYSTSMWVRNNELGNVLCIFLCVPLLFKALTCFVCCWWSCVLKRYDDHNKTANKKKINTLLGENKLLGIFFFLVVANFNGRFAFIDLGRYTLVIHFLLSMLDHGMEKFCEVLKCKVVYFINEYTFRLVQGLATSPELILQLDCLQLLVLKYLRK